MSKTGAAAGGLDLDALGEALRRVEGFADLPDGALRHLRVKGLFHDHVRIAGTGCLLRLPRASQFGLGPAANLAYQRACFRRAQPSGCTPALIAVLPPQRGLDHGGLVVDHVDGGPARLPEDMPAIAACLAAIHRLDLPPAEKRAPLAVHADPVAGILAFIEEQAAYLARAGIAAESETQIRAELAWARGFARRSEGAAQPVALCATDTHPGNFLIVRDGAPRAVFVDLEKALYGSPAIDLAHASLYTSTMWDPDCEAALARADIAGFYAAYRDHAPAALFRALAPWLLPMRRLTWLRTTTWFAKWRVEAEAWADGRGAGGSIWWRAAAGAPELVADVKRRIDGFFAPDTIARIRAEWLGADPLNLGLRPG